MNTEKKIIIVGAGGFGREVAWTIQDCNKISKTYSIEGFLDDNESLTGKKIDGIPILGNLNWFKKNNSPDIFCVVAVADCKTRQKIVNFLETINVKFATIIHPSVIYSKSVFIETGTFKGGIPQRMLEDGSFGQWTKIYTIELNLEMCKIASKRYSLFILLLSTTSSTEFLF